MKRILFIVSAITIGICSSCKDKGHHHSSFFDSVLARKYLSPDLINRNTAVGKILNGKDTTLTGDTIYYPESDHLLVIISASDHLVCMMKYLLVYNHLTQKNTDFMLVETDCDEDTSTDYHYLRYQVFNDDFFYTRHVYYIRDKGKKTRIVVNDTFYKISKAGKIIKLNHKPPGIAVPVYVPPDDVDDTGQ